MHRIMLEQPLTAQDGEIVSITGDEAHHAARVKRVEPGDRLELLDGGGVIAEAEVIEIVKMGKKEGWAVHASLGSIVRHPEPTPRLDVRTATPKGPRLEGMIDQLGQVGVRSWSPLYSSRSVVDPRSGKLDRLARVTLETAKQAGRAWAMMIGAGQKFHEAVGPGVVLADASGEPYDATGHDDLKLLVGPEGGWSEEELEVARAAGAQVVGFGRHVMRIETAAVVAAGIVLEAESRLRGKGSS